MKVLMLKDVSGVGNRGQIKEVKEGYAFNYLFKNKLAILADEKTIKNFEVVEKAKKDKDLLHQELTKKVITDLKGKEIVLKAKTNEKGHLFKAIHTDDVLKALEKENYKADKSWFSKNILIKELGEYKITIEKFDCKSEILLKIVSI